MTSYLKIDSILVFGSWNFRNTRKTRTSMSGRGERTMDQYEYLSTTFVISKTCQKLQNIYWKKTKQHVVFPKFILSELHQKSKLTCTRPTVRSK